MTIRAIGLGPTVPSRAVRTRSAEAESGNVLARRPRAAAARIGGARAGGRAGASARAGPARPRTVVQAVEMETAAPRRSARHGQVQEGPAGQAKGEEDKGHGTGRRARRATGQARRTGRAWPGPDPPRPRGDRANGPRRRRRTRTTADETKRTRRTRGNMPADLMTGSELAAELTGLTAERTAKLTAAGTTPCLATVIVGRRPGVRHLRADEGEPVPQGRHRVPARRAARGDHDRPS